MIAVETEMNHALHEAFHAAFILTGSCEGAAQAAEASLGMISPDFSREALLEETARAAVWCHTCTNEPSLVLPQELGAIPASVNLSLLLRDARAHAVRP